jgi:hypothetical protein
MKPSTMTRPRPQRGEATYRVEIADWVNGRRAVTWAVRTGPSWPSGLPRYATTATARTPDGLFTGKEARAIAAVCNRPMGTKPRARARAVKDERAAGELQLRNPTGEAA